MSVEREYNPLNTFQLESISVFNDTHPHHDQVDEVLALSHAEHGAIGWITVFFDDDDEWHGAVGEREELRAFIPMKTPGFYKLGPWLGDTQSWPHQAIVEAFALSSKCENDPGTPLWSLASNLEEHGAEYVIEVLKEVNKLGEISSHSHNGETKK